MCRRCWSQISQCAISELHLSFLNRLLALHHSILCNSDSFSKKDMLGISFPACRLDLLVFNNSFTATGASLYFRFRSDLRRTCLDASLSGDVALIAFWRRLNVRRECPDQEHQSGESAALHGSRDRRYSNATEYPKSINKIGKKTEKKYRRNSLMS